jgi:hypothetical protein
VDAANNVIEIGTPGVPAPVRDALHPQGDGSMGGVIVAVCAVLVAWWKKRTGRC